MGPLISVGKEKKLQTSVFSLSFSEDVINYLSSPALTADDSTKFTRQLAIQLVYSVASSALMTTACVIQQRCVDKSL